MKKIIEWILSFFKKEEKPVDEFKDIVWLHPNVSGWKKTAVCNPQVAGNVINMEYDKKNVWPVAGTVDKGTVANCWIIFNYNNVWYAATWEWLRKGQTVKTLTDKLGSYIKKSPTVPTKWHPTSGEKIGLFVSGLCRDKNRNIEERSNVVWMTWP